MKYLQKLLECYDDGMKTYLDGMEKVSKFKHEVQLSKSTLGQSHEIKLNITTRQTSLQ